MHPVANGRIPSSLGAGLNFHVGDSRSPEQAGQNILVAQAVGRVIPRLVADDFFPEHRPRQEARIFLEPVPYIEDEKAVRPEHSHHFPQRLFPVFEEGQPELAQHAIETGIVVRQRFRGRLIPLDLRRFRFRDFQHSRVDIDTGYRAPGADSIIGGNRNQPGSTGDIEHRMPMLYIRGVYDHRRPFCKHGRYPDLLVYPRGVVRYLSRCRPSLPPRRYRVACR